MPREIRLLQLVENAAARGIPVTNVPAYCSDEVADQGMTLLLALWRHLVPIVDAMRHYGSEFLGATGPCEPASLLEAVAS